jgi:hypothetical protein
MASTGRCEMSKIVGQRDRTTIKVYAGLGVEDEDRTCQVANFFGFSWMIRRIDTIELPVGPLPIEGVGTAPVFPLVFAVGKHLRHTATPKEKAALE